MRDHHLVGTAKRVDGHALGRNAHALVRTHRSAADDLRDGVAVARAGHAQLGGAVGEQDAVVDLQPRRHGRIGQRQGGIAGRHVGAGQRNHRARLQLHGIRMQQAEA